jgi:AhpD family alkylhydroperoxidase
MAAASQVDVEIAWDDLPLLPGVLECLAEGILPGAAERNRESSSAHLLPQEGVPPEGLDILFDPQTSGGLLIAVAEPAAETLLARLRQDGCEEAAAIGHVLGPGSGRVLVRHAGRRPSAAHPLHPPHPSHEEKTDMSCCPEHAPAEPAGAPAGGSPAGGRAEAQPKFMEFLKSTAAPGALDARTKRAIAIALSVLARCGPCAKVHIQKARDAGFSQAEIDEAAWLGISFGGSPAMMFYQGLQGE